MPTLLKVKWTSLPKVNLDRSVRFALQNVHKHRLHCLTLFPSWHFHGGFFLNWKKCQNFCSKAEQSIKQKSFFSDSTFSYPQANLAILAISVISSHILMIIFFYCVKRKVGSFNIYNLSSYQDNHQLVSQKCLPIIFSSPILMVWKAKLVFGLLNLGAKANFWTKFTKPNLKYWIYKIE